MTLIDASHEAPRLTGRPAGFTDAVTFSFGDPEGELYGVARAGLSVVDDGSAQASGLGLVFAGREPVAARAAGGLPVPGDDYTGVEAGGVTIAVNEPLRSWQVSFVSEDGTIAFDLTFTATSEPAATEASSAISALGGMEGYEQLCAVQGTIRARGAERRISCLGQRGHSWGLPDWEDLELVRTISTWIGPDLGASVMAIRTTKDEHHADETIQATIFAPAGEAAGDGALAVACPVADPRLSTTYDAEGRQRAASLELYEHEDGFARRASGDVCAGTTLDLGRLRLDCSFFTWHMEGRVGVGRYDILRRA